MGHKMQKNIMVKPDSANAVDYLKKDVLRDLQLKRLQHTVQHLSLIHI